MAFTKVDGELKPIKLLTGIAGSQRLPIPQASEPTIWSVEKSGLAVALSLCPQVAANGERRIRIVSHNRARQEITPLSHRLFAQTCSRPILQPAGISLAW